MASSLVVLACDLWGLDENTMLFRLGHAPFVVPWRM